MINCYVVQTKPQLERYACRELRNQAYDAFLPLVELRRAAGVQLRPQFTSYLFLYHDIDGDDWHAVRGTRGVAGIIGGAAPMALRGRDRELVDAGRGAGHAVSLSEAGAIIVMTVDERRGGVIYKPGQVLTVVLPPDGELAGGGKDAILAFAGLSGVCRWSEPDVTLVEIRGLLGGAVRCTVPTQYLEIAS